VESPWTSYNASLGRPLLNSSKFLAAPAAEAKADAGSAGAQEPVSAAAIPDLFSEQKV
jgi:hypothetical protein